MMRKQFGLVLVLALVWVGVQAGAASAAGRSGYLRYNVHVQDQVGKKGDHVYKASYTGWVDPLPPFFILPAGSAVTIESSRRGFVMVPKDDPKEILFEYQEKHMGMGEDEYLNRILSETPVDLKRFGKLDRQGIKEGKALAGMSKDGVLAALGIPPTHKTPSLEGNSWTYWKDRFRTQVIEFANGKVSSVRN